MRKKFKFARPHLLEVRGFFFPISIFMIFPPLVLLNHNTLNTTTPMLFVFKTSHTPAPKDLIDVQALADRYSYKIPVTHSKDFFIDVRKVLAYYE